ncbi:hypothetical protein DFH06DRAFT_532496 [Mycena polygramma]|nr:hypothetical protein DFH06DRAFT_532496 [Mycena polygramma]
MHRAPTPRTVLWVPESTRSQGLTFQKATWRCRPHPHQAEPGNPIERRLGIEHELGKRHRRMQARSHQAEPGKPSERRPGIEHELGKPDRHGQKKTYEPENSSSRARHRDESSEFGIPCGTCDEFAPRYAMIGGVREKTGDDTSDIRKPDGPCAPKRKSTEMPSMEKDPPRIARVQTVPRSKWPEMCSQGRTQGLDIRVKELIEGARSPEPAEQLAIPESTRGCTAHQHPGRCFGSQTPEAAVIRSPKK